MPLFAFLLLALLGADTNSSAPPAATPAVVTDATLPPAPLAPTTPAAPLPAQVLKQISPGVLEYNGVRLDKKNHRVSFPGTINQNIGLIEYLLVNDKGKTHESLLATKVLPRDIHLALLLIGLPDNPKANAAEPVPPSAIDSSYLHSAPKLKGPPVQISVAWTLEGKKREVPVDHWILNLQTGHTMTPGPWTYNGSLIENGVFLADQELSIVAVITDPTALVNNPRDGYDNDQIWQIQDKLVPPLDTPVDITITLPFSGGKKP